MTLPCGIIGIESGLAGATIVDVNVVAAVAIDLLDKRLKIEHGIRIGLSKGDANRRQGGSK